MLAVKSKLIEEEGETELFLIGKKPTTQRDTKRHDKDLGGYFSYMNT